MRYQKPMVVDLSAKAHAAGQDPLGCYPGDNPGGSGLCGNGSAGGLGCNPGAGAFFSKICGGGAATTELCNSGPDANYSDSCQTGGSDLPVP